ncbi:DUF1330 domain-containing protein [Hyunsoonleella pacifica]|uniref:DUF1330 domain-containing protein n=2 Tax=Hyunsoonleella pacifica TaxID=1080224 RepID=A0A4Q9FK83_9FLAO|nr:DUF1330 domain-containing protein [Hyunsoonleella pacifica]TBN13795.1 DUF1330 domain-containing protein [Hyunsoonleella pacifica]GGD25704.1 hypothetical protein GCM10011368_29710 [Hyunsoonleella pacifica]
MSASCTSNTSTSKPVYCLFENVKITDSVKFDTYKKSVSSIVEKFGGKYIVAGKPRTLEGQWNPQSLVIIKFSSLEQANRWYDCEDYKTLKALRHTSGEFNAVIMEGLGK